MSRTCPDCHNTYDDDVLHCPEDGLSLADVEQLDDLVGRNIGSYRVVRLLGKGGMGAVYMGEHPVIGSKVAIKFLHPQYSADEKIVDRFFNEARAVNLIGHDNILKILDLNVTEDDRHYFVMEFLQGRTLQALLKQSGTLLLDVAGPILLQCCDALQAAHDRSIVHRDLKPDNVYLISMKGRKNFVKIVDFGIAKLLDTGTTSTGKTQTGMVMGTPAYMSPEQAGGQTHIIDGRSDIYSLGVMMYQLATGKLPFPGQSFGEILIGHLQTAPPRPREANATIPQDYEAVILKALAKRPEDRYASMSALHEAILGVLNAQGISAELPREDRNEDLETLPAVPSTSSNPGRRTPSQPGRATTPRGAAERFSKPGSRASNPPRSVSSPGRAGARPQIGPRSAARVAPVAKSRSRAPLFVAVAAVTLAALGAGAWFVKRAADRAAAAAQAAATRAAQEAAAAAAARAAATAPQPKPVQEPPPEPVFLSVVSDPLDAAVRATWKGGEKSGNTPLSIEAPKNARIHLAIQKAGFITYESDVLADSAQTVTTRLTPEPKVAVQSAPSERQRKRKQRSEKKDELPTAKDGLIDLDSVLK